jgi:PTH2 family peptidyl-tRNA hydrolase
MGESAMREVSGGGVRVTTSEQRMAVVFRSDLPLPPGKMAAQAGHAFLGAWEDTPRERRPGTVPAKMVLLAADEAELRQIQARARARGVAAVLITDAARTVLPAPAVTALGLGPMERTDYNAITRGLDLAE